jgi:tRNA-specific 2-thiouridylase
MKTNTVYISSDIDDSRLWQDTLALNSFHVISSNPTVGETYKARTRHRAPLIDAELMEFNGKKAVLSLKDPIRAITPGQSTVLYEDRRVVGGGIIR